MADRAGTIAVDIRRVDNSETVTLRVRTAEAVFTDYAVPYAVRVERKKTAEAGDAALRQTTTSWLLSEAQLRPAGVPAASPKRGDVVRQLSGTEWALLDVTADALSAVHDCEARRLAGNYA